MTPMDAIEAVRARLAEARRLGVEPPTAVTVPVGVLDAIAHLADPPDDGDSAADLIVLLGAIDIADCSPRMVQRRAVLSSRLRLAPGDASARAGARDLIEAVRLRRRVRMALADALDRGRLPLAQALRLVLVAAEMETPGWQLSAMAALEGDLSVEPIRPRGESLLAAAQRLLVALQDRAREGLPAQVSWVELQRSFRGPRPEVVQAVLRHPLLGGAIRAALEAGSVGCRFDCHREVVLLVDEMGTVGGR